MFRSLFRRKRTIRVPIESSGHQIQEVKIFRRAISRPSNFISTFIIAYFVYKLLDAYTTSSGDDKGKEGWEEWKKKSGLNAGEKPGSAGTSEHWQRAHDAIQKANQDPSKRSGIPDFTRAADQPTDVISTITLPVWLRAKKSPLYTPDDQEYKDYVRVQSDKKKIAELKKQVGERAIARLKNPAHETNLKYIGFQNQVTVVLELVPQLHPPPLYEVPAFIVFKDGIGIGWKVLHPDLGTRMESIFRPDVTYQAAKAALNVFFTISYHISKAKMLGRNSPIFVGMDGRNIVIPPSSVMSQKDLEKDNSIPPVSQWPTNSQAMQELVRAMHNGQNTKERHSDLIKTLPLSTAVQFAAATFRRRQMIGLAHAQQKRTRGLIQVRGAVVCMGERGKYRMDVIAFYLPSEDKFVGPLHVNNAYIVKDYNQWQSIEDEKIKKLRDAKNIRDRAKKQIDRPSSPTDDDDTATEDKPTAGKEKE